MSTKLGHFLYDVRKEKKLSLRKACLLLNLSHSYLDNLEKGFDRRTGNANIPTLATLRLIAKGYDISYSKLLFLANYVANEEEFLEFTYFEVIEEARRKNIPADVLKLFIENYHNDYNIRFKN